MSEKPQAPELLRRRLTHAYLEVNRRGRPSLFKTLTKKHEREIEVLLDQEPIFYEKRAFAPQRLLIDASVGDALPDEFFTDPTAWIERQPNINRGFSPEHQKDVEKIRPIRDIQYYLDDIDVARVKFLTLQRSGVEYHVVSKRLNPKKSDFEEVKRSRKAQECNIPTPHVLAEIIDQGNLYAWFEYIPALDIDAVNSRVPDKGYFTDEELLDRIKYFQKKLTAVQMQEIGSFLEERRAALLLHEMLKTHVIEPTAYKASEVFQKYKLLHRRMSNVPENANNIVMDCMKELIHTYRFTMIPGPWFETLKGAWRNVKSLDALATALAFKRVREFRGFDDKRDLVLHAYPEANSYVDLEHFSLRSYTASARIAEILSSTVFRNSSELYTATEAFKYMCAKKGFRAENRNVLLRWDFEREEPLRDAEGNLQFLLIDLEAPRYLK